MAWLKDHGYRTTTLAQWLGQKRQSCEASKDRAVILTFDDVYESIDKASEIMHQFGFIGNCFPVSRFVAQSNDWDYQFLGRKLKHASWSALRTLLDCGWEIGSHSHRHTDLSRLDQKQLSEEFDVSRKILQDKLGCKIDTISYPFGRANEQVCRFALENGFRFGLGLGLSIKAYARFGNMCLPRLGVYRCDSIKTFARKVQSFSPIKEKMFNRQRLLSFCSQGTVLLKKWRR